MYSRLLNIDPNSSKSYLLFGPRGTGKTSWIKRHIPDAVYIDLLDADNYIPLLGNPKRLSEFVPADHTGYIVLDEIQKIPSLLDEVHRLIEHKGYRFILTGSSARALKRKGVNLLAGRALHLFMFPMTAVELNKDFDLQKAIQFGQLPSVLNEENPMHYLQTYVKTYLKEEVLQEGLTRNLEAFSRFLTVASFSQGSPVNMSSIAREVGVSLYTVQEYFEILCDLLLARYLPVFTKKAKRRMTATPKFYFFDVGVYRVLRPMGPLDSPGGIDGIATESLFLQELTAINQYYNYGYELFFWRTAHGAEVDFIAYGEGGLIAFEVKSKKKLDTADFRHLKTFKEEYPIAKTYFIYRGEHEGTHGDIIILPMKKALLTLPQLLAYKKGELL